MKLATYHDGSRDGQLVVVSRDLASAHYASGVATRLQQVLDDWNFLSPQLEEISQALNHGKARHAFAFEPGKCMAPLPRAFQWVDASAYPSHLERLRRARGQAEAEAEAAGGSSDEPVMYQGAGDDLLGPCDDIVAQSAEHGIDFEAEVAVVTGDLPMGIAPEAAIDGIRLLMLANDVTLRHLVPDERAKGFGLLQAKPATAFSPVAATPDELGHAWRGGRVHLDLESSRNGRRVGRCGAGDDMRFDFGQLLAHLCRTRNVRAGSIVGGGVVSHPDTTRGFACIAELRAAETIDDGAPKTGYLQAGETVRIEMTGPDGTSLFGAIEQTVVVRT